MLVSIGLLGIGREEQLTAGTAVRSKTPRARLPMSVRASRLVFRQSPVVVHHIQHFRIIIITLPIVLIQLAQPLHNNLKLAGLHLYIPPAAMSREHGMEKQCAYQSPAFYHVPVMVSDTMLQTVLHQQQAPRIQYKR